MLKKTQGIVVDREHNKVSSIFGSTKGMYFNYKGKRHYLPENMRKSIIKSEMASKKRYANKSLRSSDLSGLVMKKCIRDKKTGRIKFVTVKKRKSSKAKRSSTKRKSSKRN